MTISRGRTIGAYCWKSISGTWSANVPTFAPASGLSVGDFLIFSNNNAGGGPFGTLAFNVATAVVATTFTGVWEYASKVGNSNTAITWVPLSGVVDGTNGFTTSGVNTVTFTIPTDWTNWVVVTDVSSNYQWHIRFRITGVSGVTVNGSVTSAQLTNNAILLTGTQSLTMEDIYQASVSNGWGVISKGESGQYTCTSVIECTSANITFTSRDECITFGRNSWLNFISSATVSYGTTDAAGNDTGGSILQYCNYGADYSSITILPAGGVLRNSTIKHVLCGGFTAGNGHWGGGLIQSANQTLSNLTIHGMRSIVASSQSVIAKNIRFEQSYGTVWSGQFEPCGATIVLCTWINGLAVRHNGNDVGMRMVRCDYSKVASYPINLYQPAASNSRYYHVDCTINPTTSKAQLVYWTSGGASANWSTQQVEFASTLLYKITDGVSGVENFALEVYDRTNARVLNLQTQADGYATAYQYTVSSGATVSSLPLASSTPGSLRLQEIVVASGAYVGQRSIIHADATTSITLGEPFTGAPVNGTRVFVVPSVSWSFHIGPTPIASGYSVYDYRGPFTVITAKYGYVRQRLSIDGYIAQNQVLLHTLDSIIQEPVAATVAAYSGIVVDHTSGTITVSSAHTIRELYDYCQYSLTVDGNRFYQEFFTSTDGSNFTCEYNLTVTAPLSGSSAISMPAKTLTISGAGEVEAVVTDSVGTTARLRINLPLAGMSCCVHDNTGAEFYCASGLSGTVDLVIPTNSAGTWTWAVNKQGYVFAIGNFTPGPGGLFEAVPSCPQVLTSDGNPMYQGTTSALVQVSISGGFAYIDIGDGTPPLQAIYDACEDALYTDAGINWIIDGGDGISIFESSAGDFCFMTGGWRIRRWHTGDANATVPAFCQSVDGVVVDDVNGSVTFQTSDNPTTIAAAVWAHMSRTLSANPLTLGQFLALK